MSYDTERFDFPSREDGVTHPLNVGYLVVGLVFLGVAAVWALRANGVLDVGTPGWLVPAVLVAAGAVGLVASVTKERTRRHDTGPYPDTSHDTDTAPYQDR